ncbi:MAG: hypothetical protein AB7V56_06650 [Candidatus Nitrosocosmicus sp.]
MIRRNLLVKILTDDIDEHLIKQIDSINELNPQNLIRVGYSNKTGELNELIMVSDNNISNVKYDHNSNLIE